MKFPGFIGPTYTLKSVNVDAQRCINLYPEINEMGKGKEGEIAALLPTPAIELLCTVGSGPIRLVHFDGTPQDVNNPVTRVFVASGSEMYKLENVVGVWTPSLLGTLSTATGTVKAASTSTDLGLTVFVDGTNTYAYHKYVSGSVVEVFDTFANLGYVQVDNATHVIFTDTYFIFSQANSNQFFISDSNSLTVNPLSFVSAEGDPDNIVAILTNRRDLWLFNERTTEIFSNTGNADSPFERVQGGFIEKGCVAKYSIAKIDNFVFWLGRDASGQGIVYGAQGLNPERISTHAIENAIQGYADISTANAYTYQSEGHSFYVINFDEGTWVFDLDSKLWHERAASNEGNLERHRAQYHSFIPEFGIHMLGDYATNSVYKFNSDINLDNGTEIKRLRRFPHVSGDLKRVFCDSLQIDLETGVGLDGDPLTQGADPKMILRWSDDGGHTWSDEIWASMGKIGETRARAIWRRLGNFRDRVFEVSVTDPVKTIFISAQLNFQPGLS